MDDSEAFVAIFYIVVYFIIPVILFFGAWLIGAQLEKRHYRSIREREQTFARLPAVPTRTADTDRIIAESRLVTGAVVISNDPFKKLLARLRMIFGGRLRTYESLLDRARREAILRMKESFPTADTILNLRMETSTIARTRRDGGMGAVEVIAFGTAIRYEPQP